MVYDDELCVEAYRFQGVARPFPNHFHEHYVIGSVEAGERRLFCKNRVYTIGSGSIVLFNPGDNHACVQSDGGALDYRCFHISGETMLSLAEEVTGKRELPVFSRNVLQDAEAACCLCSLHEMVMRGERGFKKEEAFLLFLSVLIQNHGQPFDCRTPECRREIESACEFMERHYAEHISLEQICRHAALSRSTLLRAFTKAKGITPYRYLENVRINRAKRLLEQGVSPLDAALQTGFADQSHFTNYFSSFIGLAPGVYRDIFYDGKKGREPHE